ncbi:MAG: hypothetical protein ABR903_11375, partial [Thermodesulfovibrionales bacterium]
MSFNKSSIKMIYGSSFVEGNRVILLYKGKETFDAIFKSIREAQRLICLHFYLFRNDETGTELAHILKEKASEGVGVYIIY